MALNIMKKKLHMHFKLNVRNLTLKDWKNSQSSRQQQLVHQIEDRLSSLKVLI